MRVLESENRYSDCFHQLEYIEDVISIISSRVEKEANDGEIKDRTVKLVRNLYDTLSSYGIL